MTTKKRLYRYQNQNHIQKKKQLVQEILKKPKTWETHFKAKAQSEMQVKIANLKLINFP